MDALGVVDHVTIGSMAALHSMSASSREMALVAAMKTISWIANLGTEVLVKTHGHVVRRMPRTLKKGWRFSAIRSTFLP